MKPVISHVQSVSFGDCDPAGIMFFPNVFRWADALFHQWLRPRGGHASLCEKLGAKGLGVMDVGAKFARPVVDGDQVRIDLTIERWGARSLSLEYQGYLGQEEAFRVREVRGLFIPAGDGIAAGDIDAFRRIMES